MSADPIKLHRITNTVRPFSADTAALAESGRAIMQADRKNETARTALAEAQSTLYRIKAVRMASALGKPELADEILENFHKHDDCQNGYLMRTS